jgi:hypothetical protein
MFLYVSGFVVFFLDPAIHSEVHFVLCLFMDAVCLV